MTVNLLRNLSLLLPLVALCLVVAVRGRRGDLSDRIPAAVLASLLAWVGLLAVETATSWWRFAPGPTQVAGIPLETSVGWALTWGAVPVLVGGPAWLWWLGFAWADLLLMPHLAPLVELDPGWRWGEALLLVGVAAPALLLGRLTLTRRHLVVRTLLQLVAFAGLFVWFVPGQALRYEGLAWADVVDHGYPARSALLVAAVLVTVPALAAVAELARVGEGTPFPWDPPRRLVTTGPYAWVANPMQWGIVGVLLVLALAAGSAYLLLGVLVTVVFSEAVAEPHERRMLRRRWPEYDEYRHVHAWLPRREPYVPDRATLWVTEDCRLCRATGAAVTRLGPRGLRLAAAETAPVRMTRLRWVSPQAPPDRGVAAFGRALEHTTLPAAWLGWTIRLPVLRIGLQWVCDACGLGPRPASRTLGGHR